MTAQIHECLILEGDETEMAFCPPIPEGHPRIVEIEYHNSSHQDVSDGILFSTACWRGYQGTWEIKDGRFLLVGLRGRLKLLGAEPLFADWFSGVLRIPKGEMLLYVHMGFGSVYEQEIHVKIERGLVVASRVIDNRGQNHNAGDLGWKNMPGGENRFQGDDEM